MIPCNRIHSNRYLLYHKKIFFWSSDSTNEWCAYPSRENMAFTRFPFLKVCCCCCCCCCLIPPGWPLRAPRKVGNAFSRCFLRVRIFFQKTIFFATRKSPTSTGPKEAISTSFWILSSRWRRMQPNLGPGEEKNQKFDEILVKKFAPKSQKSMIFNEIH